MLDLLVAHALDDEPQMGAFWSEVAAAIVFFASADRSFALGGELIVDGGMRTL